MFTGIVAETGSVRALKPSSSSGRIRIGTSDLLGHMRLGDSVCVSGVCLTVAHLLQDGFEADISSETLQRSNLGSKKAGDLVNLELALRPSDRLGGHLVLGHVDGKGSVVRNMSQGEGVDLIVAYRGPGSHLIVEKGSIAVEGVSLTVTRVMGEDFGVALVPFTLARTTLRGLSSGDKVNIEVDVVGRYVEGLLQRGRASHLGDLLREGWSTDCC